MKLIGLTGGIGCGKSTVARFLEEEGIPVIDADRAGHQLLDESAPIQDSVIAAFGKQVLEDGKLSRERLAEHIFSDESARAALNAILHPEIIESVMRQCEALHRQGCPLVVVEAALLSEGGKKEPWLDGVILVLAEAGKRMERLVKYRAMKETDVRQRLAVQTVPETKMPIADWIVHNDENPEALRIRVKALAEELRTRQA